MLKEIRFVVLNITVAVVHLKKTCKITNLVKNKICIWKRKSINKFLFVNVQLIQ